MEIIWSVKCVLFQLSEGVGMSISMLEKFLFGAEMKTRMPAVSCISSVADDGCTTSHNWDCAVDVDPTEMSCQVIVITLIHSTEIGYSCRPN